MRIMSVSFWVGAFISLCVGFNKMYVYENPESYLLDKKNVHVGGDAYNMIINGTHSTAYFVLFGALLLAGLLVEVIIAIRNQEVFRMALKIKEEVQEELQDESK